MLLGLFMLGGALYACATEVRAEEISATAALPAGHSFHGEAFNEGPRQAAYLMPGTGAVSFPVQSQQRDVQAYINQGIGQLHGFWYFEAERSFRQAAALDPDCAAAYWGMAMANANNRERAKKLIQQAMDRKENASPRLQRYIEALEKLLKAEDAKSGSDEYIDALENIVYEYPDDIEAKAFIALHAWEGRRTGQKIRSHLAIDALIGEVLTVSPMHPVHHYRIHLWDHERPERALASAARCGQSAPAIAHMWHMPGHIYSRLKRYPDAVWQQEASARTDHAQMVRDRLLPDQIHNFAHNNEWLIRNLIYVGRIHDALDLAKNMIELPQHPKFNTLSKSGCSASYGRKRLLQVLDKAQLWQETLRLSETVYLETTDSVLNRVDWLRAVGRAHYHLDNDADVQRIRTRLQAMLSEQSAKRERQGQQAEDKAQQEQKSEQDIAADGCKARRRLDGEVRHIERVLKEMDAYHAAIDGNVAKAIELLEKSDNDDMSLMARWQVESGDPESALETLSTNVKSHERETLPLAHLASLQWDLGRVDTMTQSMEQLRERSAEIDLRAPPFSHLSPIAHYLGWPRDWRVARAPADDVGQRPSLDSLGPFRWHPTAAPDWTLPNADHRPISLADYRGRPVLVIFYLGFGCLHCAEQLQAFGPRIDDFHEAGIEMVAISSDDADGLKKSLEAYDGDIPFPLLADDQFHVFRQYRVFDDFEDQPLHGTFLIDAKGDLRWHDISYEPFMDHEFVLTEARRLLAQSPDHRD